MVSCAAYSIIYKGWFNTLGLVVTVWHQLEDPWGMEVLKYCCMHFWFLAKDGEDLNSTVSPETVEMAECPQHP